MKKTTITFPRSHNTWSTTCPPKLIIKSKNHLIYAKEHRIWKPSFLSLLLCGKLLPYINLHPVTDWWVTNLLNPELSPFLATVQHTTSMLMPRVYESSVAWASLVPVHNKNSKHYLFIWRQEHVKYRSTETHGTITKAPGLLKGNLVHMYLLPLLILPKWSVADGVQ